MENELWFSPPTKVGGFFILVFLVFYSAKINHSHTAKTVKTKTPQQQQQQQQQ